MVYLKDFEEFYDKSETLFREDPAKTRYVFKFRKVDANVVLKVTNDKVIYKYLTDKDSDFANLDRMNGLILQVTTTQ
ncbi:signal recognition particle 9 kDa subunit [Cavenderia fasciculata]|uniref:Signal recognition particle 9 kDa protein n=1 Tax=Cavenderia fasciculata TaxID=261658 RepID=F4Q5C2_CACFS|nr:signal recognition particle 9 kDa subunit [Cavenderia fasciculata]EGG17181.1 signal recognition particle 9 kDa subunit [Cavenderia fasciculata]|eukprot:XP_004355665.1 signal recognition particle 9 kDa subunit [Cavenderia fasciculata]